VISQVALIDVDALKKRLSKGPDDTLRLVHVADATAFAERHIPGAIHVAPAELVAGTPPAIGKLPPLARLNALFSRLGYTPECEFILCDDEGGGWAGRFAWTLDMIGMRRWQYLNGGIHAWAAAGEALATGPATLPEATQVSLTLDPRPQATVQQVLEAIDDPQQLIWDVRSAEEFAGQRSGSARAGHIPGAVNIDWLQLKNPADAQRLLPGLRQLLKDRGVDLNKRIITHCQTHHRSGLSYMIARLLDCQDIRAYDGSWSEWGNLDDTPVTG